MTDGCAHLLYNNCWKLHQLAAGQLLIGQPVRYGKGRLYGPPSPTKTHLPGHSPPAGQAGRRVGPALEPSASLVIMHVQNNGLKSLIQITLEFQDLNIIQGPFWILKVHIVFNTASSSVPPLRLRCMCRRMPELNPGLLQC